MSFKSGRDNKEMGSSVPARPSAAFARLMKTLLILFMASCGVMGLFGDAVKAAGGEGEFMPQEAAKTFSDETGSHDSLAMTISSSPISVGSALMEIARENCSRNSALMTQLRCLPSVERLSPLKRDR